MAAILIEIKAYFCYFKLLFDAVIMIQMALGVMKCVLILTRGERAKKVLILASENTVDKTFIQNEKQLLKQSVMGNLLFICASKKIPTCKSTILHVAGLVFVCMLTENVFIERV